MNIIVLKTEKHLLIKINGFLHLQIILDEIISIQSWRKGKDEEDQECPFVIEYLLSGGVKQLTAYWDINTWKEILLELENLIIINCR